MPDKFKNRYRIESNRMPVWDYSGNGTYFITLVVQHRECLLGAIENQKMILTNFGEIVKTEWIKSFEIRAELFCDEYMVMPNHLHAIVVINKLDDNKNGNDKTNDDDSSHVDDDSHVETHGHASLRANQRVNQRANQPANQSNHPKFYRKPKSLSSFVAGFKSATNTKIDDYIDQNQLNIPKFNKNNHFWQPNYHDHVIRNQQEYNRIKQYIKNNPKNWTNDKFNRDNST